MPIDKSNVPIVTVKSPTPEFLKLNPPEIPVAVAVKVELFGNTEAELAEIEIVPAICPPEAQST